MGTYIKSPKLNMRFLLVEREGWKIVLGKRWNSKVIGCEFITFSEKHFLIISETAEHVINSLIKSLSTPNYRKTIAIIFFFSIFITWLQKTFKIISSLKLKRICSHSTLNYSRMSNIESNNSQNGGLEDYNSISDFLHYVGICKFPSSY